MNDYATSTTVGGQGEIHLAGVPFLPGTQVEVVVSPKTADSAAVAESDGLGKLFAALDQAHNREPVRSLRREGL